MTTAGGTGGSGRESLGAPKRLQIRDKCNTACVSRALFKDTSNVPMLCMLSPNHWVQRVPVCHYAAAMHEAPIERCTSH